MTLGGGRSHYTRFAKVAEAYRLLELVGKLEGLGVTPARFKFCLHFLICSVKYLLSPSLCAYKEDMEEKQLLHRAAITNNLAILNEEFSLVPVTWKMLSLYYYRSENTWPRHHGQ